MSTQFVEHRAYLQLEDLLDSVGQRYRVFLLIRGLVLFAAMAMGAAALTVDALRAFCADRLESFLSDIHAREHKARVRLACTKQGEMLAFELDDVLLTRHLVPAAGAQARVWGQVVTYKRIPTKRTKEAMAFVTLEDPTGLCELVFFPKAYARFGSLITSGRPLVVEGKVEKDEHPRPDAQQDDGDERRVNVHRA